MPSPALTYRITTLGCRVNHAEARDLESVLLSRGLVQAAQDESADLEVVHSCSVTNTAAAKSRQFVRRAARRAGELRGECPDDPWHRQNNHDHLPSPKVLVTGCYAATHPEQAASVAGGAEKVVPHESEDGSTLIERFTRRLDEWLTAGDTRMPIRRSRAACSGRVLPLPVVEARAGAGRHVRAELRIQDGCDAHCTFCVIPRIRRTLRSKRIRDAVQEARRLVELGHREIVLSGIFIGAYGHETALRRRQQRPGAQPLAELMDAVAQVRGLQRLRISSMEPGDVSDSLLDAMVANRPVVVPHLHLPLQSGSDRILRRMNRQYRVGAYLEMISQVNEALTVPADEKGTVPFQPQPAAPAPLPPAITTDIICGFPGETEEDFHQTLAVAERVGFLHMHVFPFSARAGTAAARWTRQFVDDATKRRRVRTLIDLENAPEYGLSIRYRRRLLGRTVRVVLEQPEGRAEEWAYGRCDHYALVRVRTRRPRGSMINVRIDRVRDDALEGRESSIGIHLPVLP